MNRDILLEAPLGQCHELLLSQKKPRYVCLKIGESQGDVGFSHVQKPFVPSLSHSFPVSQSSGEPFFCPIPLRQEAIEHFRLFRGLWRRQSQGRPHEYTKGYMHLLHIYMYICMYMYMYMYIWKNDNLYSVGYIPIIFPIYFHYILIIFPFIVKSHYIPLHIPHVYIYICMITSDKTCIYIYIYMGKL